MNDASRGSSSITQAVLADLPAFRLGNATDAQAGTGTTVIVAHGGAVGGVSVRGGGPATRETDLLRPENMVEQVFAVMLSGGSAFGLAAADGVMLALEEAGIGLKFAGMCVPIVPSACLFDLLIGDATVRPDASFGRVAVQAALEGVPFEEGAVGAGTGASVGKLLGPDHAMKSGLGLQVLRFGDVVVGAVVAVNACGCVIDRDGSVIAGMRDEAGQLLPADSIVPASLAVLQGLGAFDADEGVSGIANTTIGCIMTNAVLTKAQASKVADMTHDAFARAIMPVHTPNDGDTVFCLASGEVGNLFDPVSTVGILACEAMQQAVYRAVHSAQGAYGLPAAGDMRVQ
jgi:L-aminopeptidase/D-esterase-like protein